MARIRRVCANRISNLLHKIWLEVSEDPELASLHHYHIVGMALERLNERLHGPQHEEILALLKKELQKPDQEDSAG